MNVNTMNTAALLAAARESMSEAAVEDRRDATDVRRGKFDASIEMKIEAADHNANKAEHDYHVANVEGMLGILGPVATGITMGKDEREKWATSVGVPRETMRAAETIPDIVQTPVTSSMKKADRSEAMKEADLAAEADIAAERLGKEAADAKETADDARDFQKQILSDARSIEAERREAFKAITSI